MMGHARTSLPAAQRAKAVWRWAVIAAATLALSACSSVRSGAPSSSAAGRPAPLAALPPAQVVSSHPPAPRVHYDGAVQPAGHHASPKCACCNPGGELPDWARAAMHENACPAASGAAPSLEPMAHGVYDASTPWAPPGIRQPWPYDEYLFDGGDQNAPAVVDADWSVRGIEAEDTIVHYDTLAGETRVTPSNRVPLYAPRFRAVRKVSGLLEHEVSDTLLAFTDPRRTAQRELSLPPSAATQPVQPVGEIGLKAANTFRERTRGVGLENAQAVAGFHFGFLPYEDFSIIRYGVFEGGEKLRLATAAQAAIVWTGDQAAQVVVDGKMTQVQGGLSKAQQTFVYELPPGKPCVRLVKVASTAEAQPGDVVDFTLRFDNAGDQTVGNVTILDNLTGRLEYVPDSAQCSLGAQFFTQQNEHDSLVLRWEISEPLKVGQGGVIRFRCRVR